MRVRYLDPDPKLAPFVRTFTVVETDAEAEVRTLMPDTGLVLGFRYSGSAHELENEQAVSTPPASLVGLRGRTRTMRTAPGGGIILATLRDDAAAAFFREPLHELFEATVDLDCLIPKQVRDETSARIGEAATLNERVRAFEGLLVARLRPHDLDPIVIQAVRTIRLGEGVVRVGDIARELGLSRDRFEKRFRRAVGTSAKRLASIFRMRRAIALSKKTTTLAELAAACGYFDQSHFIREFRAFTGETPGQFFRSTQHC